MGITYGAWTAFTVTNLTSIASDATDVYAGWGSSLVDNQTSVKADDYEIFWKVPMSTVAPANDQAAYAYVVPWQYDGTTWYPAANYGTTVQPSTAEGTANISDPNSMKGPYVMPYKTGGQILQGFFNISQFCRSMPDGFSLAFRNATGAASSGTPVVAYRSVNYTS